MNLTEFLLDFSLVLEIFRLSGSHLNEGIEGSFGSLIIRSRGLFLDLAGQFIFSLEVAFFKIFSADRNEFCIEFKHFQELFSSELGVFNISFKSDNRVILNMEVRLDIFLTNLFDQFRFISSILGFDFSFRVIFSYNFGIA